MTWPVTTPGQRIDIVSVIEAPAEFVSVQDVHDYLIIEHTDWDNGRIPLAIRAAQSLLDGPRGWLGRALGVQTLELATYRWTGGCRPLTAIDLPYPPLIDIVSVEYDLDGSTTVVDAGAYRQQRGACQFVSSIPTHDEMRIRYTAGYPAGDSPAVDPKELQTARMAALLLIGDFLRNTSANVIAPNIAENPAVQNLLAPLKLHTVA